MRDNAVIESLAGLSQSLRSVGGLHGGDIYIEDNAQLRSLGGLKLGAGGGGSGSGSLLVVHGSVNITGNGAQLPAAEVQALQSRAAPVQLTAQLVARGLPGNKGPAAGGASNVSAAPALPPGTPGGSPATPTSG